MELPNYVRTVGDGGVGGILAPTPRLIFWGDCTILPPLDSVQPQLPDLSRVC